MTPAAEPTDLAPRLPRLQSYRKSTPRPGPVVAQRRTRNPCRQAASLPGSRDARAEPPGRPGPREPGGPRSLPAWWRRAQAAAGTAPGATAPRRARTRPARATPHPATRPQPARPARTRLQPAGPQGHRHLPGHLRREPRKPHQSSPPPRPSRGGRNAALPEGRSLLEAASRRQGAGQVRRGGHPAGPRLVLRVRPQRSPAPRPPQHLGAHGLWSLNCLGAVLCAQAHSPEPWGRWGEHPPEQARN